MPFIGLSLIIQIAFAIHAIRTGKDTYWLYIIIFIPGIGAAIYFFTQVLPDLGQSRTVNKAKYSLIKAIDPQRELRKRKDQLELANTLENKVKLAEECFEANMFEDAIELFKKSLNGVGEGDPHIMEKLAMSYFGNQQYNKAIETLDELIHLNPNFKSSEGHLLYARCHEELGNIDKALEEYAVVSETFAGEEARVRYALLLKKQGDLELSQKVLKKCLNRSKLAPKFYQKKEKYWINQAKSNLE
jgi:hypothetical protein